ncbi:NADH-quinone oxidoreductase subunit L [Geochorda subterranea]|uniref:NADH-quinone oxidoreductase subunit L n=1 Tax=Geochorda subterranea TaxID=3109564 RepID=A0ABZ1BLN8_9FIRM|nr:NADH-quinone oxidoreductase subunit L [Limnochorda sp. LNt]WRP13604.1 NADH-quinone oxidoreductase subunit L [Limnochorda sp. LNt]
MTVVTEPQGVVASLWPAAVVGVPLAGALLLAAAGRRMDPRTVAWIGVSSVGAAFAAAVAALLDYLARRQAMGEALVGLSTRLWSLGGPQAPGIDLGLLGDGLSLWFALVVTGVGLLIHVYSVGYMAGDPGFRRYFAQLNYFIFAMSLLVMSDGLVGTIAGWANVGLASYLLIGFWYQREDARAAAIKAFLVTFSGEVGLVLATALLWHQTGTVQYYVLFDRLAYVPTGALTAAGLLLLWAAAAKSAQLPLHVWLPDAMAGPTPVSALIHAATMVTAGVYLTARMYPLYAAAPLAQAAVAWVGGLSALMGAVVACGQTDIKRVLAYSTMSQIGYMLLGVGVAAEAAGVFHFFTQAFFKALLFLAAGLVIHGLGGEQDMTRMGGLARSMRLALGAYLVGAAAMMGIPPFSGFYSKDAILEAVWSHGHVALWAIGIVAAALTAFYSVRMLTLIFGGAPGPAVQAASHGGHGHPEPAWVARAMGVPVVVLAVLATAGGWVWIPGRTAWAVTVLEGFFGRFREGLAAAGHAAEALPAWILRCPSPPRPSARWPRWPSTPGRRGRPAPGSRPGRWRQPGPPGSTWTTPTGGWWWSRPCASRAG